eukprot:4095363-Pyramimonas_sp.AAC.1
MSTHRGGLTHPLVVHEAVPHGAHHLPHIRQAAEVVQHHQAVPARVPHALRNAARRARRKIPTQSPAHVRSVRLPIAKGEREYTHSGHQSQKGRENIPIAGT